jgi:hypothetical protein
MFVIDIKKINYEVLKPFLADSKKRWPENLARASFGLWVEALNFLDSFVYFSHQVVKV